MARRGIAAYEKAEEAAKKCDRAGLAAAVAEIKAIHAESRAIAAAAKRAGKLAAVDYIPALNVSESMAMIVSDAEKLTLSNCPADQVRQATPRAPEPKEEPKPATGEIKPQSVYRPGPGSEAEKAKYVQSVETEFENVEFARERRDCDGWKQAMARLRALLNDYRANTAGLMPREKQFDWIMRMRREEQNRPDCGEEAPKSVTGPSDKPSVGPEPAYTKGFVPDGPPPKTDAVRPAEAQPNPEAAKEEESKRKRPR